MHVRLACCNRQLNLQGCQEERYLWDLWWLESFHEARLVPLCRKKSWVSLMRNLEEQLLLLAILEEELLVVEILEPQLLVVSLGHP